jgi:methyl-accepting chemotaxis protein
MKTNRIADLKVVYKIILLVILGLSMSLILLISTEFGDYKKNQYEDLLGKLRHVQMTLLDAVGAEQQFLAHALEKDKNQVMSYGREGLQTIATMKNSSLDQQLLSKLNDELNTYISTFETASAVVISGNEANASYKARLAEVNKSVEKIQEDVNEYLSKIMREAKKADKFVTNFAEVVNGVNLALIRDYMTLQNMAFLESNVEGYLDYAKSHMASRDKQLRNINVLHRMLKRKKFESFSNQGKLLLATVSPMADLSKQLAEQWSTRIETYKKLNNARAGALSTAKQLIETELANNSRRLLLLKLARYGIVLILCLVFIFFSYYLARSISKPLAGVTAFAATIREGDLSNRLEQESTDEVGQLAAAFNDLADGLQQKAVFAAKVASGDLSEHVELTSDKDALGQALEKMVTDLNDLLSQVDEAVMQVEAGAKQLSESGQLLSRGATDQAASLEQITSSVTELAGQTKTNAENATQANDLSLEASQAAKQGTQKMELLVEAMEAINASGSEIAKIIKAIDEIAFQTNLLALNAAVEAARAGTHGKGFAVVAEEVRNLASRSAQAAHETAELIETSAKKTENGSKIVSETAEALSKITEKITKASDLVSEIAAASNEQALGITQINEGLNLVDRVTQQNSANAEETASTSEVFSKQAGQLSSLVAQFKLAGKSPSLATGVEAAEDIALLPPSEQESTTIEAEDDSVDYFTHS